MATERADGWPGLARGTAGKENRDLELENQLTCRNTSEQDRRAAGDSNQQLGTPNWTGARPRRARENRLQEKKRNEPTGDSEIWPKSNSFTGKDIGPRAAPKERSKPRGENEKRGKRVRASTGGDIQTKQSRHR
jgi:hypothetical protein